MKKYRPYIIIFVIALILVGFYFFANMPVKFDSHPITFQIADQTSDAPHTAYASFFIDTSGFLMDENPLTFYLEHENVVEKLHLANCKDDFGSGDGIPYNEKYRAHAVLCDGVVYSVAMVGSDAILYKEEAGIETERARIPLSSNFTKLAFRNLEKPYIEVR
ncbi:MAG: hypothetical protein PHS53_03370 [Candidatus Pacebacteria bacterium]|nr:hypothetical protein [Candidatus Paceibacterota bacterium]MDD5357156.1 hypothetical protein [Candidatus Paceibacterota bacterium]